MNLRIRQGKKGDTLSYYVFEKGRFTGTFKSIHEALGLKRAMPMK